MVKFADDSTDSTSLRQKRAVEQCYRHYGNTYTHDFMVFSAKGTTQKQHN
jgi:hypothetical protein